MVWNGPASTGRMYLDGLPDRPDGHEESASSLETVSDSASFDLGTWMARKSLQKSRAGVRRRARSVGDRHWLIDVDISEGVSIPEASQTIDATVRVIIYERYRGVGALYSELSTPFWGVDEDLLGLPPNRVPWKRKRSGHPRGCRSRPRRGTPSTRTRNRLASVRGAVQYLREEADVSTVAWSGRVLTARPLSSRTGTWTPQSMEQ